MEARQGRQNGEAERGGGTSKKAAEPIGIARRLGQEAVGVIKFFFDVVIQSIIIHCPCCWRHHCFLNLSFIIFFLLFHPFVLCYSQSFNDCVI